MSDLLCSPVRERIFGEKVDDFRLRALGSKFQGHPVMNKTPGVDMTSGSLGNGIAIGAGMAIAGKYRKKDYDVFVIAGDGELQEGICWEGINLAAAKKLDHMIVFVDKKRMAERGFCGRDDRLQQYSRKVRCIPVAHPGD